MKVLLIDAMNVIRRVFEASLRDEAQDVVENTLRGSLGSIRNAINEVAATHALCCLEGGGVTWRHEIYGDYKGNRVSPPQELAVATKKIVQHLIEWGIQSLRVEKIEADDVIGSVAKTLDQKGVQTVILSTDKDFNQLISKNVIVRHHYKKEYRDEAWVEKEYGVSPTQFIDVLSFIGDSADNIPGVPGVGPAKAAKLIQRFGSVDKVIEYAYAIEGKMGLQIRKHTDDLLLSQQLITIKDDIQFGLNMKDMQIRM